HVPHGLANALLLPHVLRFNLPAAPARYAAIARALGVADAAAHSDLTIAEAGVARLEELAAACGLPRGLDHLGVTPADIPALVSGALQVTRLLRNNLREITAADATAIYQRALSAS
ncbi:MAG TPA: iron-containing alcohol dehydrogenase, partial [Candidatus Synoicihabitans sp.]|nr:iron-containing alcohol dehydrogenase [Candidatus Synoicihabitans sp.]